MTKVLAIRRAERFSPNCVERDLAIISAVRDLLEGEGLDVDLVGEESLVGDERADLVLTMGREERTLDILSRMEADGTRVINPPAGVRACRRRRVDSLMREHGLPAAPTEGKDGYWIKRADLPAQEAGDVVYAGDAARRELTLGAFKERGIDDVLVTAHVVGDCVKFYGVSRTGFFRVFYPTDDMDTKFGLERMNGRARHYGFPREGLWCDAERLSRLTGAPVYGGDAIVRHDGSYAIIDFNDWPSFSRCRQEAARAIAALAIPWTGHKQKGQG